MANLRIIRLYLPELCRPFGYIEHDMPAMRNYQSTIYKVFSYRHEVDASPHS